MNKKVEIEYSKRISSLVREGRTSFCFHPNKNECSERIILSHGLQENGKLSLMEADYKGQNKIFSLESFKPHYKFPELLMPKPKGKGNTTTFKGFCAFHDTNLFSEIENNNYKNTPEHNFRNSYRSFAYSYQYAISENKSLTNDSDPDSWKNGVHKYQPLIISGENILERLKSSKNKLDKALTLKTYDYLNYFVYKFNRLIPLGSCGVVHPQHDYFNNLLSDRHELSNIILTVFPDNQKLICIFAFFPNDSTSLKFQSHLKDLNQDQIQSLISSLLIHYSNSTSFSPKIWAALKERGQKQFCKELSKNRGYRFFKPHLNNGLIKSPINLFADRFIF